MQSSYHACCEYARGRKLGTIKWMRIGLYDPYLDTLGGGERYILTAASCLSTEHDVVVFWDDKSYLTKAEKKFNLNLSKVTTEKNIFSSHNPLLKRMFTTKKYDVLIFMSDGSIPFLFAQKNILLFQFPVNWVHGSSLINTFKLRQVDSIICYTDFVKEYLDKTFNTSTKVIYPPVEQIKGESKENIILSVGRFTKAMNAKKQEVLIQAFKEMYDDGLKDWKLVLAGSYLPEDKDFVEEIESLAKGYPITVSANAPYTSLVEYYKKAKIYWHAAGYGEDLKQFPERAEHFGITTVEAMAAGSVPIVINGGGQKEIVTDGVNGYLWSTIDELKKKTVKIVNDTKLMKQVSHDAVVRAKDFSEEKFCKEIHNLIQK
jgi:glycosyltransferase involved in cell wall biosynthesis